MPQCTLATTIADCWFRSIHLYFAIPIRFVTYKHSKMKIKDLSSSKMVAGEGIIKWNVSDSSGATVTLKMPGFHIPYIDVWLLSPQALL